MKSRSAQAAVDFLITYGWALFAVFAVIGILAYFGILSPEKFVRQKCMFLQSGFNCISYKVESSETTIIFSNMQGRDIIIDRIAVGDCAADFKQPMLSGSNVSFQLIGCGNGIPKEKFKVDITVKYTEKDNGVQKTASGILETRVE